MREQRVSQRYAYALLDTAIEESSAESTLNDLDTVEDIIETCKDLKAVTKSPVIQHWKKKKIFTEILQGQVQELTLNFILLLTEKNREGLIIDIIYQYRMLYDREFNRLNVDIHSASELNDLTKNKLLDKLAEITGKIILPHYKVNPSLKGGISVKIHDWVYDATIKNKLENLYESLAFGQSVN